ncbi:MAG: integrase/recombinase XerD [Clostridia bacterium]|nr:integrase/recombinase XerD [Clostridia bacterium]
MPRINNHLTFTPIQVAPGMTHPASQDFDLALELFIRDRKLVDVRPDTIKWYTHHLHYFKSYLLECNLPTAPAEITLELVEDFVLYLRDECSNKPQSVNGKIRALKAFFSFLNKKNILEENPLKDLRQIRHVRPIVPTFTEDQIRRLLKQPDLSTFTGFRDYTIMCLLLDTGVRIGELLAVNMADLTIELTIPQEIKIKKPKNSKERVLPLSPQVQGVFRQYLDVRKKTFAGLNLPHLFPNVDCGKFSKRTIQGQIKEYGRMAGIENVRVSPHTFRHTFAKMWVMADGDILSLQEILGHSSVEMVRNYARLFQPDLKKKHARYSPVATLGSLGKHGI